MRRGASITTPSAASRSEIRHEGRLGHDGSPCTGRDADSRAAYRRRRGPVRAVQAGRRREVPMSSTPRPDRDVAAEVAAPHLGRRTFLRSAVLGGAALAGGGLLEACSSSTSPSASSGGNTPAPKKGGNLRVGLTGGGSSDTLNPFFGGISAIGTARAQQLYQPLIQLANNAQLQYVLAEEIVPNGSTSNWLIKLRSGVTFHNGKAFGADDVIYTLQTILNPKKPLGGAAVLSPVDVNGLKKVDNLTVEVPMKTPFGSFPERSEEHTSELQS